MKIICSTTFIHGRERYEAGDARTVDDDLAAYFIGNGWAHAPGDSAPAGGSSDATLAVADVVSGQGVSHG